MPPSIHLPVRPSACPSICPCVCPSVCWSVRPFARLSVRFFVCPSVCSSVRPFARPSVCSSVRSSVRPFARLSVRFLVCPSVRLSVRFLVCPSVCSSVVYRGFSSCVRSVTAAAVRQLSRPASGGRRPGATPAPAQLHHPPVGARRRRRRRLPVRRRARLLDGRHARADPAGVGGGSGGDGARRGRDRPRRARRTRVRLGRTQALLERLGDEPHRGERTDGRRAHGALLERARPAPGHCPRPRTRVSTQYTHPYTPTHTGGRPTHPQPLHTPRAERARCSTGAGSTSPGPLPSTPHAGQYAVHTPVHPHTHRGAAYTPTAHTHPTGGARTVLYWSGFDQPRAIALDPARGSVRSTHTRTPPHTQGGGPTHPQPIHTPRAERARRSTGAGSTSPGPLPSTPYAGQYTSPYNPTHRGGGLHPHSPYMSPWVEPAWCSTGAGSTNLRAITLDPARGSVHTPAHTRRGSSSHNRGGVSLHPTYAHGPQGA